MGTVRRTDPSGTARTPIKRIRRGRNGIGMRRIRMSRSLGRSGTERIRTSGDLIRIGLAMQIRGTPLMIPPRLTIPTHNGQTTREVVPRTGLIRRRETTGLIHGRTRIRNTIRPRSG